MQSTPTPASRLTRAHFSASPIWELPPGGGQGEGESCAHPVLANAVPTERVGRHLVAAVATLKDKTEIPASMLLAVESRRISLTPAFVFLLDRQLPFVSNETERLLSRYTAHAGNRVVRWQLAVPLQGERRLRQGAVRRSLGYMLISLAFRLALRKRAVRRA